MGSLGTGLSPYGGCGPKLMTMGFPYMQVTLEFLVLLILTVIGVVVL